MIYLKIVFYAILAFIERNPKLCIILALLAIFAPVVFKFVGWIILGIIALAIIIMGTMAWRMRTMQRTMEREFGARTSGQAGSTAGGFNGFGGFSNMGGMSLEELVRRMQAEADARKATSANASSGQSAKANDNASRVRGSRDDDYVDFEEIK